jgi:hypothetical protein
MGLFSSVLHVRDKPRKALLPALDAIMRDMGYSRSEMLSVSTEGPFALPNHDAAASSGPYYLVSQLHEPWLTVIEAHFAVDGAPHLTDVGKRLSSALSCYALTLIVHDDDLFFYNLDRDGRTLDGYNSCPQYFEQERLPDEKIDEQRHNPEPFQPLLPSGRSVGELRALLKRGWWTAFDSGSLDENGVALGDIDSFVFEGDRMTAFGTLLQLHGGHGEYPYTAWGDSMSITWPEFIAVRYRI